TRPAEEKEEDNKRLFLPNAGELAASLPEKYKTVFVLRYTEGMKYKDIAQKTGIPMGTVKTYLFRAKAVLSTSHQKRKREDA
ncbi:MAG: sigma-70 region 4 domain-containing protein, partial [Bacteroidales bacterium]|nr:sigma-70 region 4 domain-containing protein [Bacteroidales bacterium]